MRCSKCEADNREGRKFCAKCGSPLALRCRRCGASNEPAEGFCGECGAALSLPTAAPRPTKPLTTPDIGEHSEPSHLPDGERRHLTVMFCDLVGSTEIASHLDPEEWREIVGGYHSVAAQAIERFGGSVAQYLGDGVMAYFGYPEAHDNDAERGARAGLAILDAVTKLNEHPGRPKLSARIGIDSGSVVVGAGTGREADVFGDTPNIASRVQSVAAPDSVVVTSALHQLIAGRFVVENLGPQHLKGIETPLQLYRVIQPGAVGRHTPVGGAARTLIPFVGRDDAMRLLISRWERARRGEGQLALITGEPGIGKSRLVEEFHARIKSDTQLWLECMGEQFFDSTPFHAVTQMLAQGLNWRDHESKEDRLVELERAMALAGMRLAEAVPLIAEMLNLPTSDTYPQPLFAPDQKRKRLVANLARWVVNMARRQPVKAAAT